MPSASLTRVHSHPLDQAMHDSAALTLSLLEDTLAVCRLSAEAGVPEWAWAGEPASVTRTRDELSIVCREAVVPAGVRARAGGAA